jgi:hypothetical protein
MALTAASHARYRAGFQHFRAQWAYNLSIPRAQEILGEERAVHTAEHLASAMFWLGARGAKSRVRDCLRNLAPPQSQRPSSTRSPLRPKRRGPLNGSPLSPIISPPSTEMSR